MQSGESPCEESHVGALRPSLVMVARRTKKVALVNILAKLMLSEERWRKLSAEEARLGLKLRVRVVVEEDVLWKPWENGSLYTCSDSSWSRHAA